MTDLHVYRYHCWACQLDRCPHEPHDWADGDDIEGAAMVGRPDPTGEPCTCPCASGPTLADEPEPEWDSLDATPCPVCHAPGACSYDAEGRPLIHTTEEES